MGVPTDAKKFTIKNYGKAFLTVRQAQVNNIRASVVIIDATYCTKFTRDQTSGDDFFFNQVVPEFEVYFKRGCNQVYLIWDRGSPGNKYLEHLKRYKNIVPHQTPKTPEDVARIMYPGLFAETEQSDLQEGDLEKEYDGETPALKDFVCSPGSKEVGTNSHFNKRTYNFHLASAKCNEGFSDTVGALEIVEHKRQQGLNALENLTRMAKSGDPFCFMIITDLLMPNNSNFKRCMANPQLKAEFLHYLTSKIVADPDDPMGNFGGSGMYKRPGPRGTPEYATYFPQLGNQLCLHGGLSRFPDRDEELTSSFLSDRSLIIVGSEQIGRTVKKTVCNGDSFHPPEVLENLGEGEIAAIYYSLFNLDKDQLVVTVDGDVWLISLLACRYRMFSDGKTFRNTLHVLLKLPKKKKKTRVTKPRVKPKSKDALDDHEKLQEEEEMEGSLYVNINALHDAILSGGTFSDFEDPIMAYVLAVSLMGNDYIKDFAPGLRTGMDTVHQIPWLLLPFVNQPRKFKNLVKSYIPVDVPCYVNPDKESEGAALRSEPTKWEESNRFKRDSLYELAGAIPHPKLADADLLEAHFEKSNRQKILENAIRDSFAQLRVEVNHETFQKYTDTCYFYKYKDLEEIRKKVAGEKFSKTKDTNPTDEDLAIYTPLIREVLSRRKKGKMMTPMETLAFSRRIEWLLSYWLVAYTGNCTYPNPFQTKEGKSYYGWQRSGGLKGECQRTDDVYFRKFAKASNQPPLNSEGIRDGRDHGQQHRQPQPASRDQPDLRGPGQAPGLKSNFRSNSQINTTGSADGNRSRKIISLVSDTGTGEKDIGPDFRNRNSPSNSIGTSASERCKYDVSFSSWSPRATPRSSGSRQKITNIDKKQKGKTDFRIVLNAQDDHLVPDSFIKKRRASLEHKNPTTKKPRRL